MTDTTVGRQASGAASPLLRVAPAVVVTVILGVLLGRFLFLDATSSDERAVVIASPNATLEEQVAALEERLERSPDDLTALQDLGVAAVTLGIQSGDLTNFARADAAIERAEALAPNSFRTRYARASLALTLHDFDAALEHGRAAAAINPFSTEALGVVVDAQVELGLYDDAAADLRRMLDLDPALPALARVSYLRELHGDVPGALQAMQQAETAAGVRAGYRLGVTSALVGALHLRLGHVDEAAAAFERADAAEPGLEAATIGLATVAAVRGAVDAAIDRLAAIEGPSAAAATLLGDLLRLQGREAEAAAADDLARANFAAEAAVGHIVDLDLAAFEIDRSTDSARSVDLARIAYAARPTNVSVNDTLAWALVRDGRAADALPFVEQALRLRTTEPAVRVHAAAAFAGIGQRDRAAAELRLAFAQAPWTAWALQQEAAALAAELDVPLPDGLRTRVGGTTASPRADR